MALAAAQVVAPVAVAQAVEASGVAWSTHPTLPAGMSISNGKSAAHLRSIPATKPTRFTLTKAAIQLPMICTLASTMFTHTLWWKTNRLMPSDSILHSGMVRPHGAFNLVCLAAYHKMIPQEITGMVDSPMSDTFTVTATHSSGATETFTFSLESLLDTDGDGLANDLPPTYNSANPPTSGLIADDDDDGDGLLDSVETDTGLYVDGQDTGTDPLDPDTDDDGICDGPMAVLTGLYCRSWTYHQMAAHHRQRWLVSAIPTLALYHLTWQCLKELSRFLQILPLSLSIDPNTGGYYRYTNPDSGCSLRSLFGPTTQTGLRCLGISPLRFLRTVTAMVCLTNYQMITTQPTLIHLD